MRLLVSLVTAALLATPVLSHEFWIEPQSFQVETGDLLVADFRNGQNFKGGKLSWFDHRIARSELQLGQISTPLTGRAGDMPAISLETQQPGLLRIVHQTTLTTLTYREAEKFQAFVDHKNLDTTALPNPSYPLAEGYTRYAKSLVAVGSAQGQDANAGLEIEFIALKNPYTQELSGGLPLQLIYGGSPRGDAQVEIFDRDQAGDVSITLLRTDADGMVTVPVTPGHSYLIDSVVLRRPEATLAEEKKIVWESLWASLTFAVPE